MLMLAYERGRWAVSSKHIMIHSGLVRANLIQGINLRWCDEVAFLRNIYFVLKIKVKASSG